MKKLTQPSVSDIIDGHTVSVKDPGLHCQKNDMIILFACLVSWLWVGTKALRNWKILVKALSKRLRKLTIITKRLIVIIIVSFVNVKY